MGEGGGPLRLNCLSQSRRSVSAGGHLNHIAEEAPPRPSLCTQKRAFGCAKSLALGYSGLIRRSKSHPFDRPVGPRKRESGTAACYIVPALSTFTAVFRSPTP
jgi:hypothetical protein